jgi:predicted Fe-Mo cluster-binding NifX family protein
MRIAIPTNDKETLFKRSGQAKGFLVADISGNGFSVVDYRKNSHSHHHHHGEDEGHHGHSHKEITDALGDCDFLVVNMIGKHFGGDLKEAGIKIFKTDKVTVNEAINHFIENEQK